MAVPSNAVIQNIQMICIGAATAASGFAITGGVNVVFGIAGLALLKGADLKSGQCKAISKEIKEGYKSLQGPDFEDLNLDVINAVLEDNIEHLELTPSHLMEVAKKDSTIPIGDALAKYIFDRFTFVGISDQEKSAVKTLLKIGMNAVAELEVFRDGFIFEASRYTVASLAKNMNAQAALEKLQQESAAQKISHEANLQEMKDLAMEQQKTIQTLVEQQGKSGLPFSVDDALKAIAAGDNSKADVFFDMLIKDKSPAINEAAALFRQRGALWYGSDSTKAIAAYKRATELDGANVTGWNQLGNLYHRVGQLDGALSAYQKVLDLGFRGNDKAVQAVAYGNMGMIFKTQGDLDQAMQMYQKALDIDKTLGHKEGMASIYGNIGVIFQTQGDLDQAMQMYQKALDIDKMLGHKEGMAILYGNMGVNFMTRGNLDQAMQMYQKSLAINKARGRKEGMAIQYGNIGLILQTQGDLGQAMQMYQKSLDINKALGRKEGMAIQYVNMGITFETQGDLDQAREVWNKALVLFTELGSPQEAMVQSWLDSLAD